MLAVEKITTAAGVGSAGAVVAVVKPAVVEPAASDERRSTETCGRDPPLPTADRSAEIGPRFLPSPDSETFPCAGGPETA